LPKKKKKKEEVGKNKNLDRFKRDLKESKGDIPVVTQSAMKRTKMEVELKSNNMYDDDEDIEGDEEEEEFIDEEEFKEYQLLKRELGKT